MNTKKIIFWNVDTQYDFMRGKEDPGYHGKLAVPGASVIEGNLERLTNLAAEEALKVVNTADWHDENTKEISSQPDFKKTFPAHCMERTKGARFVLATAPDVPYVISWKHPRFDPIKVSSHQNVVLYKDHFDIFQGNPHANDVVRLINPGRAIVYGVATNVCVNYAVLGLLERGIEVYVVKDAIKELPGLPLPYDLWKKKGAKLVTTSHVERMVRRVA